ncbi:HNH endonuclease signature motif containing protein [Arthrobacter sp. GMC3]|uniref:HNH endonuclease n=1 Tax=Arthrobacter sp. GMC3 TaxID=2058894 RepID=UPI000CE3F3D0
MPRTRAFPGNSCEMCGQTIPANGTSTAQQRKARFCSMTCRQAASTSRQLCCEHCGNSFRVAATRERARFCSVACRSVAGRRDVTCEHCGKTTSFKANRARIQRFCNRACMFAALGCAVCSKIRPAGRQAAGDKFCSDACNVTARLEEQAAQTGQLFAVCSRCRQLRPGDDFTKEKANRNGLSYECKECARGYYQQNKDNYRLRRYVSQAAPGGIVVEFTPAQKTARFSLWGGRCWMCGIEGATQNDHVKPIVKGGSHCLSNLRPICRSCNASKGGRWPLTNAQLVANFVHPNPRAGTEQLSPRRPRVDWTCPLCMSTFLIRAHEADSRKHCSKKCSHEARRSPSVVKKCLNPLCGKRFELPDRKGTNERKFCSIECAWVARDRPAHWGGIAYGQLRLF